MSAEILRRAAAGIRAEFADAASWSSDAERPFYMAVASWLESQATSAENLELVLGATVTQIESLLDEALAVARAFLGEAADD